MNQKEALKRTMDLIEPKTTHTPTPWKLNAPVNNEIVSDYGGADISVAEGLLPHDAAFIVRAVNAHEGLISMCKGLLGYATSHGMADDIFLKYDKAIAKTEGRS